MKNITVNIPNIYDEVIQRLKELKFLVSRSETFRTAIREFLNQENEREQLFRGLLDYD